MTTLLVSVTGDFLVVSHTNIGYVKKFDERLRAAFLAKSGMELANMILKADKKGISGSFLTGKTTDKNIDSYNDIWAINIPSIPIEDGTLHLSITDENSKLNLSVLATEFADEGTPYYGIAERFFINLDLPIDLAHIIRDWVDIDDSRAPYGAESSDYYQTLPLPYKSKNTAMSSIDELFMLKDFTPEIFYGLGGGNFATETNLVDNNKGDTSLDMDKTEDFIQGNTGSKSKDSNIEDDTPIKIGKEKSRKLSDYFRVYGDRNHLKDINKININTASYRLISALTDNMTDDIVTELIRRRLQNPFRSVDEIKDLIPEETARKNLTVKSVLFKISSTATFKNTIIRITAYYNRDLRRYLYWCEE